EMTMSVSIPKCTVGVKDSVSELTGEAFLKKEILTEMMLDYYYSKSGRFYEELYNENLIDDSFYASSSLEKSFGYTLIGSNTRKPEAFATRVKEQLLSAKEQVITE